MNIEEIFASIANRLLQGAMVHQELTNYYNFLGLYGYKECHEYHFLEEICNYRKVVSHFMDVYNKFVIETRYENPRIIPESWRALTRYDVDINTKRSAVKNGVEKWITWETETKKFLEQMYHELVDMDEIAAALCLKKCIKGVDKEIIVAQKRYLEDMATDYDLSFIMSKQQCEYQKYRKKMERKHDHDEHE